MSWLFLFCVLAVLLAPLIFNVTIFVLEVTRIAYWWVWLDRFTARFFRGLKRKRRNE